MLPKLCNTHSGFEPFGKKPLRRHLLPVGSFPVLPHTDISHTRFSALRFLSLRFQRAPIPVALVQLAGEARASEEPSKRHRKPHQWLLERQGAGGTPGSLWKPSTRGVLLPQPRSSGRTAGWADKRSSAATCRVLLWLGPGKQRW